MRRLVVLSGEILDDNTCLAWMSGADRLICADGGARHLRRMGVKPDLLVGDLDSIKREDREWLERSGVPCRAYPVEKDETDSEIALAIALSDLPKPYEQHEIIVLAAFGDRPDHVLANQMLAARLAAEGWRLVLTDGVNTLFTLIGGQKLSLDLPVSQQSPLILSAIPVNGPVSGLTYGAGLQYPLVDATLMNGSTRGVSNLVIGSPVEISLGDGVLLVIVTSDR